MRVLMTVSSSSLMDGIDRHILAIAPALNALTDVEVGVVTLHPRGDVNEALKSEGVRCWSLDCSNGHQLRVLPRFCKVMREFRPDILHGHVTGFFENVAHKWLYPHVKRVVTIHGVSDPITHVSFCQRIFQVFGFDRFCGFLANKRADAHIYISHGVLKANWQGDVPSFVVYNPMAFEPTQRQYRHGGRRVIGTVCRVESVKDPLAFTRVMGEVTKRFHDVEAWVIGDGHDLHACRQLAEEKGYGKIRFWGHRNDAKELVAQMDCFVLTSKREGLPTSLLEAMSVKTPVAFMAGEGGLQDLAELNMKEGPFAVVVASGDEEAMTDGVYDLLTDSAKAVAYADRAFEVGQQNFNLDGVVRKLSEVYQFVRDL